MHTTDVRNNLVAMATVAKAGAEQHPTLGTVQAIALAALYLGDTIREHACSIDNVSTAQDRIAVETGGVAVALQGFEQTISAETRAVLVALDAPNA